MFLHHLTHPVSTPFSNMKVSCLAFPFQIYCVYAQPVCRAIKAIMCLPQGIGFFNLSSSNLAFLVLTEACFQLDNVWVMSFTKFICSCLFSA